MNDSQFRYRMHFIDRAKAASPHPLSDEQLEVMYERHRIEKIENLLWKVGGSNKILPQKFEAWQWELRARKAEAKLREWGIENEN